MKVLIQRVSRSAVEVDGACVGEIGKGILLLLGVEADDSNEHVEKALKKVLAYRMFSDEQGKMNLNIKDAGGQLLVVSQFTLVAQTNKGNRPGFSKGATPSHGEQIYNQFVKRAKEALPGTACGQFGADMQVSLVNDGPVTFMFEF
ncbi:MAG: D-aminoacyl-tRNA deacylase [Pseudomonadales bacterium]